MTPYLFRTIGLAALAVMLVIAAIWMLQEAQLVELIENPLPGVIGFGLVGLVLYWLGARGAGHKSPDPDEPN